MITYVDSSTLIKLIVEEDGSDRAAMIWSTTGSLASVSLITVECRAALAAAERGGRMSSSQLTTATAELAALGGDLHIVDVTEQLVSDAADLAETEGLRGDDAIHLAAALLIGTTVFTSADRVLCEAASRRGLHIANPVVA